MKKSRSRRQFIKKTLIIGSGVSIIPAHVMGGTKYIAPSDKITIGVIGTGKQARGLASRFGGKDNVQIMAAADVDGTKLNLFQSHLTSVMQKKQGGSSEPCDIYREYGEILERDDIDAVIIATPDHWHAKMSIDAMNAGKDVYCEKPLAHTIEQGRDMVDTAAKTQRILQTGSMQRSRAPFRHAVEIVRNGYLGEIQKVLVNVGDPAIACDLESMPVPQHLDWDAWVGPAKYHGYNTMLNPLIDEDVWAQWRQFAEYGGGILSDWGAHMFDIAQWALDMDRSGPVLLIPPADRSAKRGLKMIYDSGVEMVHEDFDRGWAVRFIGSEGTLDVSRQFLDSKPGHLANIKIANDEIRVYHSDDHYEDWINAIKERSQPICDVETGHRSSSVCNLANIAYQVGRPLRWDPVKEKFAKNKDANRLIGYKPRKGYK